MSISVLMSVYKSEKAEYLDRALQSVWDDQTCKPDEIVLVEDGPLGSDLRNIISAWKDKLDYKLTVIVNEQNLGLTKSLNKGIGIIRNDYIARMDSDDISTPDRMMLQKDFLDRNPDIHIVGGALQEFDEQNECLNVRRYPATAEDSRRYIHKASPLAHPTVMMRKSIFDNGLKYDERYRTSQDIALWFEAMERGFRIANISEITIKFRRVSDVYKRRGRKKAFNEFKIYMSGIRKLDGILTFKYLYPLSRLFFRLMPPKVVKFVYGSALRRKVLE